MKWPNTHSFLGNLFDDTRALEWIFSQADDDSIEELTSPMIEKLIREAKNVVVLFCKYAGYLLIALTHTCYMLRHFTGTPSVVKKAENVPATAPVVVAVQNGDLLQQIPNTFLPPDKVKGLAREAWTHFNL